MKQVSRGRRPGASASLTAFWDTSGVVPLCTHQIQSAPARQAARVYSRQVVWWATPVEAISAFHRLTRDAAIDRSELRHSLARLDYLRERWSEIQPTEELRDRAEHLLATHKLCAADALQLSAALAWSGNHTRGRFFIGSDGVLADAAEAEGFTVIRLL